MLRSRLLSIASKDETQSRQLVNLIALSSSDLGWDGTNACNDRLRNGDFNTPHGGRRVGAKQLDVLRAVRDTRTASEPRAMPRQS
jgi:hypothetical protein